MGRVWPRHGHRDRPFNKIVRGHLSVRRHHSLIVAAAVAPLGAFADAGGPGLDIFGTMALIFYAVLCILSVPTSLILLGPILKRLLFGFTVPIVGIGLSILASTPGGDGVLALVVSVIPIVAMGIWGVVQRVKANAL